MGICKRVSSALPLALILASAPFYYDMTTVTNVALAELQVIPSWDSNGNFTQSCNIENGINEGVKVVQGSTLQTCSIQVTSSRSALALVEIQNGGIYGHSYVYVERQGDLNDCPNKYIAIRRQSESCNAIFMHKSLQVSLQGNVSLSVSEISADLFLPLGCPEFHQNITFDKELIQVPKCYNVQEYNDTITCDYQSASVFGLCRINLKSKCNARLSNREVIFQCVENNDLQQHKVMVIYPDISIKLDLADNNVVELDINTFEGLLGLQVLYLDRNYIEQLHDGVFHGLNSLRELWFSGNRLVAIDTNVFHDLPFLNLLILDENDLLSVDVGLFSGLAKLTRLSLGTNRFSKLPVDVFQNLENLNKLRLSGNMLGILPVGLFQALVNLGKLYLTRNQLSTLDDGLLQGLTRLTYLSVSSNMLSSLPVGMFHGLNSLKVLFLHENQLVMLQPGLFRGLESLLLLSVSDNLLTTVDADVFRPLSNLKTLGLNDNRLTYINNSFFNVLTNLEALYMGGNTFDVFDNNVFKGVKHLTFVNLSENQHSELGFEIFKYATNLSFISLSKNKLDTIPNIKHLSRLYYVNLRENPLTMINSDAFAHLPVNTELYVSQHEICKCYVPKTVNCSASNNRSPYLTCNRLLADRELVVMMWIIGFNALGGNIFVLAWRRKTSQKNKVQQVLLSSLAISDLLMGIYMLIIASADAYFGDHFPMHSEGWRSGITCRIAGTLSILSSEASVFFLTLISVDRLICVRFPFSTKRFNKRHISVIVLLTWMFAAALGVVPSVLSGVNFKFYDNSHVCIGLPLALTEIYSTTDFLQHVHKDQYSYIVDKFNTESTGTVPGLYFSTATFLGLNCLCYLIILGCYVEIVRTVYKSSKRAGLNPEVKEQLRMTAKVAAIVVTDFCCWFPIILLGILVQARVLTLPPSVFAWSVTFILPINSAINPYLYTIADVINSRRKLQDVPENRNTQSTVPQRQMSTVTQDTQLATINRVQCGSPAHEAENILPNVPMHHGLPEIND